MGKMATKDESPVDVDFAVCSCKKKKNVFTLYQGEYFFISLWVCYRTFKASVQRYSMIGDIEGKRELI